jgi:predicted  nucleic acid-binding Zn-ribbon protein
MTTKEDYTRRLEERLRQWDDKLDTLKAKTAQASEDMKQSLEEQRAHLVSLREEAADKLTALKEESESSWEAVKEKTEATWEKMADKFEKITSKWGHRSEH